MRRWTARLVLASLLLVLVAAGPAGACHRMDPDHVSVGHPQSGPYVLVVVLRGCDHATGVCAGLDGDVDCVPDHG